MSYFDGELPESLIEAASIFKSINNGGIVNETIEAVDQATLHVFAHGELPDEFKYMTDAFINGVLEKGE